MLQLGFGRIVTTIPRRFIDRCRNVDFSRTSNAQFLYPYLKSCALHPESSAAPVSSPMIRFVSLERLRAMIRSSTKNICHAQ
jgi:hypothetical protein